MIALPDTYVRTCPQALHALGHHAYISGNVLTHACVTTITCIPHTVGQISKVICDRACKNRPYEHKLYQIILLLIYSVQNVVSHFSKLQKKAN